MQPRRPDLRTRELAAIHAGKRQLGMDDATYRDMLWTVARVRSAADLDEAGRRQVLEHLRARGFTKRERPAPARGGSAPQKRPTRTFYASYKEPLRHRLQEQMRQAGVSEQYVNGMAKRICKVDAIEFCDAEQLRKLVAAMEYHLQRMRRKRA